MNIRSYAKTKQKKKMVMMTTMTKEQPNNVDMKGHDSDFLNIVPKLFFCIPNNKNGMDHKSRLLPEQEAHQQKN